jgi:hypothetical protein
VTTACTQARGSGHRRDTVRRRRALPRGECARRRRAPRRRRIFLPSSGRHGRQLLLHSAAKRVWGREHREETARGAWLNLTQRRSRRSLTLTAVVAAASDWLPHQTPSQRRENEEENEMCLGFGKRKQPPVFDPPRMKLVRWIVMNGQVSSGLLFGPGGRAKCRPRPRLGPGALASATMSWAAGRFRRGA